MRSKGKGDYKKEGVLSPLRYSEMEISSIFWKS